MTKKLFLVLATVITLVLPAAAAEYVTFKPGLVQESLDNGETVLLNYNASWCPSCKKLGRTISTLRSENSEYDENITFVSVDWDDFGSHEVTTSREVVRHSTLVLLRGTEELGRVIGANKQKVKDLLDLGLQTDS